MSSIVFFDPSCMKPYDSQTLTNSATGGTEGSVVRIADALGAYVIQHNRSEASGRYRPPEFIAGIDRVVVIRDSRALATVNRLFPHARVFLWLHDKVRPRSKRGRWLAGTAGLLRDLDVRIVCVSNTQRQWVEATLRWMRVDDRIRVCTIYNPIDDALAPDGSPVDDHKLVFLSSPNKGLKFTLDAFRALRRRMPDLRLVVGNPGYKDRRLGAVEGVEFLGPQPQSRMHAEVRTALCTFFPNFVIPETFGLVFAESNALGTPVLTHDCGAAREVIGDDRQVLPVTAGKRAYEILLRGCSPRCRAAAARAAAELGLFDDYIERIHAWQSGERPQTRPDPRFRLSAVAQLWRELLAS